MIDLEAVRRWGTTVLMLAFLFLWRWSERQESRALEIAAATVETTDACVVGYGAAVDELTLMVRGE